jgi:hypothetical protein
VPRTETTTSLCIYLFEGDQLHQKSIYGPEDRIAPVLDELFGPA